MVLKAEGHTWFEAVTGHSRESAQAWRDNFNDGWAAGDWTGNHNAAIAEQKAAAAASGGGGGGGASVVVDDSHGAALLAQAYARLAAKQSGSANVSPVLPNNAGGVRPDAPGGGAWAPAPGPGTSTAVGAGGGTSGIKLKTGYDDVATQVVIGGRPVNVDPGWSNAEAIEQRYGEAEFMSPGWFYGWGVTLADAWHDGSAEFNRWDADHGAKAGSDINRWIAEHNPFAPRTNTGELVMGGF